jgi:hypothetical protein
VVTPFPEYLDIYFTRITPAEVTPETMYPYTPMESGSGCNLLQTPLNAISLLKEGKFSYFRECYPIVENFNPIDRVSTLYILACRYNVDSKNDADRNRS